MDLILFADMVAVCVDDDLLTGLEEANDEAEEADETPRLPELDLLSSDDLPDSLFGLADFDLDRAGEGDGDFLALAGFLFEFFV